MARKSKGQQSCVSDIEVILQMLDLDERREYVSRLYSIAKDAIKAQCRELKVMDLEVMVSLEAKADANFEEWLHRCMIQPGL